MFVLYIAREQNTPFGVFSPSSSSSGQQSCRPVHLLMCLASVFMRSFMRWHCCLKWCVHIPMVVTLVTKTLQFTQVILVTVNKLMHILSMAL